MIAIRFPRWYLILAVLLLPITGIVACVAQEESASKALYNSEREAGEPISPQQALDALILPEGFTATLFASEPDVQNPIAACTDAAGRVWVAENYTYAERSVRFDLELSDRVVVLTDRDRDGVAEDRQVFLDGLKVLTGITVGRGGVWLMCPPQVLFVPDADQDLVPDGPPEVLLDGFHVGRENYHNFANGLAFGPDSWLYGRCGASSPGDIGLPGSTPEQRIPLRGGMWRYHPVTQQFEVLVQGTTNPWGHDWNEFGDLFFINTVNGHFWHCIPGAHYVRPHTIDVYPYSYELIDMHADHWHFDTGKSWTASRDGAANSYGGGHAHIGMMIYQESLWPEKYQGGVFTVNMHGRRINQEQLSRVGSGYEASHVPDFVLSKDDWFRGMEILPMHDGNVLLIDWSDTGECHEHTGVHRTSGRIFKIAYEGGSRESQTKPLAEMSWELEEVLQGDSEWHVRKTRDRLATLAKADAGSETVLDIVRRLEQQFASEELSVPLRLRALWSLHSMGATDETTFENLMHSSEPALRSWGVRLFVEHWRLDTTQGQRPADEGRPVTEAEVAQLLTMAQTENSPRVRLDLASAMQRLPHRYRSALAQELVRHAEDADDHNLPLMIWYGLAPLGEKHLEALVDVFSRCELPTTRRLIARRVADQQDTKPAAFQRLFAAAERRGAESLEDAVLGTSAALAGWRKASAPTNWSRVGDLLAEGGSLGRRKELGSALQGLDALFGDGRAIEELMRLVRDKTQPLDVRKSALKALVDANAPGVREICLAALNERFLNRIAAMGLAKQSDALVGREILKAYRRFHPSERSFAISTLASRSAWALSLLDAVEQGKIDPSEISAFQARQMHSLNNELLNQRLAETWGQVRVTPKQKQAKMEELKSRLTADYLSDADKSAGRAVFQKSCSSCHRLYGSGGQLGPDLTGAQRSNIDYLLQNIVDPSAVVTKEFRATILLLEDDRTLTGLVTEQTDKVVTLATQNETFRVPREEIALWKQSDQSTMPDGLLDQLSESQVRDLFGYLQSTAQVELPTGP